MTLPARYYDGQNARAQAVRLRVADGHLIADDADAPGRRERARWPLGRVHWPEATRHGQRVIHLPEGASLEVPDAAAFDAWRATQGHPEGWVSQAQQSWRGVAIALVLLVALLVAGYQWGLPLAARGVVALLPEAVDRELGDVALRTMGDRWLRPSALPAARQQALRERFLAAARALPGSPEVQVRFHALDKRMGPNAFALPGGTLVFSDALVNLMADQEDALLGVFGHELGHVRHRHGLRAAVQVGLLSAATSLVLGDVSGWLAGVPTLLGQLDYSRAAEREADVQALALLRQQGVDPAVMVVLFERMARARPAGAERLPLALASHPADEERIAFFRNAGR